MTGVLDRTVRPGATDVTDVPLLEPDVRLVVHPLLPADGRAEDLSGEDLVRLCPARKPVMPITKARLIKSGIFLILSPNSAWSKNPPLQ
jgi:DNA-binding transcriptional LysR family regulator